MCSIQHVYHKIFKLIIRLPAIKLKNNKPNKRFITKFLFKILETIDFINFLS